MKRFLQLLSLIALCTVSARAAALSGTASITFTGTGPYQYFITLTNTGTGPIGTFWFAWVPGQNYLATSPTSVQDPTGWTHSITPPGGGFAIEWVATTPLASGQTINFSFTSTDTPLQIAGNSLFFSHPKVTTTVLYAGQPLTGTAFQLIVQPIDFPTPPSLAITTTNLPDGTNNENYSQTLVATGGTAPYTWTVTSGLLPKGLKLSSAGVLSGKPAAGGDFNFTVKATDSASTTGTQPLSLTILTPDLIAPKLTLTSPKTGTKEGTNSATVSGTATDNIAISNVLFSVNGGDWTPATLVGTAWTAQAAGLLPGTNTFAVFAVDTSGNVSATNTIKLDYIVSAPLVVTITPAGSGTLKPDLNGELLAISNRFSMKAKADKGFGFQFWSLATDAGTNMTNNASLSFTMVTNLVITANFVDNQAPTLKIISPKANAKETNGTVTVSGTATDNLGVTAVGVQINTNDWVMADGTNNWSTTLPVSRGPNTIRAYAMDAAGNISKTNTVKFTGNLPPDWAPDSLADSTVLVTPDAGAPLSASFSVTNFSQTDTTTTNDSGTGSYAYNKSATNIADLLLTFDAPPGISNSVAEDILLTFTSLNAGRFTNSESSGAFSIEPATTFLPPSFSGHTITAVDASHNSTNVVKFTSKTGVTVTSDSVRTGTYTVTSASPVAAMIVIAFTGSPNVTFLQVTFSSKSAGNFDVNSFDCINPPDSDFGTFTFK